MASTNISKGVKEWVIDVARVRGVTKTVCMPKKQAAGTDSAKASINLISRLNNQKALIPGLPSADSAAVSLVTPYAFGGVHAPINP